jgi:hypothetical protein
METVTHHQGYCTVAVANDEPYSATYHVTKDDWTAGDAPVRGLCPGFYTSQAEALVSAIKCYACGDATFLALSALLFWFGVLQP